MTTSIVTARASVGIIAFLLIAGVPTIGDVCAGEDAETKAIAARLVSRMKSELLKEFGAVARSTQSLRSEGGDTFVLVHGGASSPLIVLRCDVNENVVWDSRRVRIQSGSYRYNPRIVADSNDGLFVMWRQTGPNGFFVRRIDRAGSTAWERRVTGKDIFHYDVARRYDDSLVLGASNMQEVFVLKVEHDGRIDWQGNMTSLDRGSFDHNPVTLALWGENAAVVVWMRFADDGNTYVAQRVDLEAGVASWSRPARLGSAPSVFLALPPKVSIAKDGETGLLVDLVAGSVGDAVKRIRSYQVRVGSGGDVSELRNRSEP